MCRSTDEIVGHPGQDSLHLPCGVSAVVLQVGAPQGVTGQGGFQGVERQPEGTCREQRARDIDQVIVQETNLERVLGKTVSPLINLTSLGVAPEIVQNTNC